MPPELVRQYRIVQQQADPIRKSLDVRHGHDEARFPVLDILRRPAGIHADDRPRRGHRFEQHVARGFERRGQHEDIARSEVVRYRVTVHPAQKIGAIRDVQRLAELLQTPAFGAIATDDDAEVVRVAQARGGFEHEVDSLARDEPADGEEHRSFREVQLPLELLSILRRLEPRPIDPLFDDTRAVERRAQRDGTVAHEGTEIDRAVRTRQQAPDRAVVEWITAPPVIDPAVEQDVGATQARDERAIRRGGREHSAEAARPAEVAVDEVDPFLVDDLGGEALNRHRAVELTRVPHVRDRDRRPPLERESGGLRAVPQRARRGQRSELDRTDFRIALRPRREHEGVNAGGGERVNLLVDKRVGGKLPGTLGLRNEVEHSHW